MSPYVPPVPKASLATLTDVGLVTPTLHDILKYGDRTAGKWTNEAAAAGSTLNIPGSPPISGAIVLEPTGTVALRQVGQNIVLGSTAQQARTAAVFAPGALSARTLQKLNIPGAVLSNVDAYFGNAPAGVSGAACANLVIAGSTSGSLTIPFSSATPEYHSGAVGSLFQQPTNQNPGFGGTGSNFGYVGFTFTPTSNLVVSAIQLNLAQGNNNMTDFCRVGIASALTDGQAAPVTLAAANALFVADQSGAPAFADVAFTALPFFHDATVTTINLATPVSLASGTTYSILLFAVNAAKTAVDTTPSLFAFGESTGGAASPSGNANYGDMFFQNGAGGAFHIQKVAGQTQYPGAFAITGTGNGTPMVGIVTVSLTLTGAPATPGNDLNVLMQF